jgi:hypothetical protein
MGNFTPIDHSTLSNRPVSVPWPTFQSATPKGIRLDNAPSPSCTHDRTMDRVVALLYL